MTPLKNRSPVKRKLKWQEPNKQDLKKKGLKRQGLKKKRPKRQDLKRQILNMRKKYKPERYLFLLPSLLGVGVFVLAPFGYVVISSFYNTLTKKFVGIFNYLAVFGNTAFRMAAFNTARFIITGVPALLLLSLLLAVMIDSRMKWEKYKYLYLLPMAVPAATMVLVWKLLFSEQGVLNHLLQTHVELMETDASFYILVGSYLWKNLGYTLVLWLAGLRAIPTDIIAAAKVDGAGKFRCFFLVTLPNLKGSMYTILVVSLLNSFKVFREVYLIGGTYPQERIYLLQHTFNNWYVSLDFDKMSAGAVLSVLVLGSISLLLQKMWDQEK